MPKSEPELISRKDDHIRINLEQDVHSGLQTGLDAFRFIHQALPEIDLADVDLSQTLFGKRVTSPLLISSMTGGTGDAMKINTRLAEAAQQAGIAMGVGSQRAAIEFPEQAETFQIRKYAPTALIFANLGAVQLNYGYNLDHCQRAVEMVQADGLILHLNSLQEVLQPEGDTRWSGVLEKIEQVCRGIQVPVVVKEVGWGISEQAAMQLAAAGVTAIDVAGAGGTSWSQVERFRIHDPLQAEVAGAFRSWGIPTAESIQFVRKAAPNVLVFASGGLRDGIDAAKCIALGASLCGMAGLFLKAAVQSTDAVMDRIYVIRREMEIASFAAGAASLQALQSTQLIKG
ncbi:MAG: type 2 isopentenyl-diphosphate Delta-isomerase [Anaerolineaceae bacterium]|nr:type 2 isopentenyl-diphosphate Delta-isomerase [Anaerolineaceae bacterium]